MYKPVADGTSVPLIRRTRHQVHSPEAKDRAVYVLTIIFFHAILCSITVLPAYNELAYNEFRSVGTTTNNPFQACSFCNKIIGYKAFGYNNSSPISYQIFVTRRAFSSDMTFRNVPADIGTKPVVHSGQSPYSYTRVALRSLLWTRENMCCSRAERPN